MTREKSIMRSCFIIHHDRYETNCVSYAFGMSSIIVI